MTAKFKLTSIVVAFAAVLAVSPGQAGPLLFDTLAGFNSAKGNHSLSTEDFETLFGDQPSGYDFGGFIAESEHDIEASTSVPGTKGPKTVKISEREDKWIKFTFDEPIFAFRIDIIDALDMGVGDIIVTVDGYLPVTFINDSTFDDKHVLFLGIIDWDGFTMVTIDATYNPDKVYYDNLRFTGISEPSVLAMFGLGLAGLGLSRRRRAV